MKLRNNFVLDDRTVNLLYRIKNDYSKDKKYKEIIHQAVEQYLLLVSSHLNTFSIRPNRGHTMSNANSFVLDDRTVELLEKIREKQRSDQPYREIVHRALAEYLLLMEFNLSDFCKSRQKRFSVEMSSELPEQQTDPATPSITGSSIPVDKRDEDIADHEKLSGIIMIDLEDWEKRVLQEKDQLDQRIEKLESFLKSRAVVETIPHVQKQMMEDQLKTMIEYSEILNDRVAVSLSTKLYELMGIKEPINTHYS